MAKPFKTLVDQMSPESRARAKLKSKALIHEIRVAELREAIRKTHQEVARSMGSSQSASSRLANAKNSVLLPTLARHLESIGAELIVTARFPDEDVQISLESLGTRDV